MDRASNWMRVPGSEVLLPLPVMVVLRLFCKCFYEMQYLGASRQSLAEMIRWNEK